MATIEGLRHERRPARADYDAYLHSPAWRARRRAAIEAAGGRCQICSGPDDLEAHHRTYARFGHEAAGDLTILCDTCHALVHGRLGVSEEVRARAQRRRARIDVAWERTLERSVADLQAALNEAIYRLSVGLDMGRPESSELRFARLVDARVKARIGRTLDRIWALKGVGFVTPGED